MVDTRGRLHRAGPSLFEQAEGDVPGRGERGGVEAPPGCGAARGVDEDAGGGEPERRGFRNSADDVRLTEVGGGKGCGDWVAFQARGGGAESRAWEEIAAEATGEVDDRVAEEGAAPGAAPGNQGMGHHFETIGRQEEAEVFTEAVAGSGSEGCLLGEGGGFEWGEGDAEAGGELHRAEGR